MTDSTAGVLLVDNREVVRRGLRDLLNSWQLTDQLWFASNMADAFNVVRSHAPSGAIVRDVLADKGLAISALAHLAPAMRIIELVDTHQTNEITLQRRDLSVCLECNADVLVRVFRHLVPTSSSFIAPLGRFTTRERSVLVGLAAGDTNVEISRRLHISSSTVKQQASCIYRKLQVRNRAAAVLQARRIGLIE